MRLPKQSKYIIVGAGIHGLSTAYHLAEELHTQKKGNGSDIVLLDKGTLGMGASGIACGVIRNNYFQPAMRELMAHSVEIWESDQETYAYNPVGYMQISHEGMCEDVNSIFEQQKSIGYESEFIEGANACEVYMKNIFYDWQAKGITSVLHEKKGGYSHNKLSLQGLAKKATALGVQILENIEVHGFRRHDGSTSAIKSIETNKGSIECDYVVIGAGPWIRDFWDMLELPKKITINNTKKEAYQNIDMWTFWQLEEGVLKVDPALFRQNNGQLPPVIHVDSDAPLLSITDGKTITQEKWGIYYKPDIHFDGIQGGAMPYAVSTPSTEVSIDPYGPASPEFISSPNFALMWCSALAHCHKRFEDTLAEYDKTPSGGIGCFTPDCFPVIDIFFENCHIIADSNHGYKMIGIGKLIAQEILGQRSELLKPFRFNRYANGKLHPTSNSPFPWS